MDRSNPYETAFEAFLTEQGLCYVAVDETRRAVLGDDCRRQLEDRLEIDQVPFPTQFLVAGIHPRRFLRAQRRCPARLGRGCRVLIGADLGDLGPLDF